MKQSINVLVIHDGQDEDHAASVIVADELRRLDPLSQFHFSHLRVAPDAEYIKANAGSTVVFRDDSYVGTWRREPFGSVSAPPQFHKLRGCYFIDSSLPESCSAARLRELALEIKKDLFELFSEPQGGPQSAVHIFHTNAPLVPASEHSER